MLVFRGILVLLLVAAGISFALYAGTRQVRYKRFGLALLKWTLFSALGFYLVLVIERLM